MKKMNKMNKEIMSEALIEYAGGNCKAITTLSGGNEELERELFDIAGNFESKWNALECDPEGFTAEQNKVADELIEEYTLLIEEKISK